MNSIQKVYTWSRTIVPDKYRNPWFILLIILFGSGLDNFNVTATVITMDSVQSHFGTSYAIASWTVSGYALTLGSFIILFGKLADILGPDNMFILGINIFWVCSLICALVDKSIITLIFFRAIQGIGGAALIPSSYALLGSYFHNEPKKLQFALGLLFISLTGSLGTGALVGGAFSDTSIGYQGLFYFVFASSFILSIFSILFISPIEKTEEHKHMKIKNIDFIGMSVFIAGALLVILGLTEGGDDWNRPSSYIPLPLGVCLIVISCVWELVYINKYRKGYEDIKDQEQMDTELKEFEKIEQAPKKVHWLISLDLMFPTEALKVPDFTLFVVGSTLYYLLFAFVISLSIEYNIYVKGDSAIITACKVIPYVVALCLCGLLINEREIRAIGPKVALLISSTLVLVGYIVLTRETYNTENAFWKFGLPGMFLYGFGESLYFKYYFVFIFPILPVHLQGIASGIFQSFSQIGFSVGNALLSSLVGQITVATTDMDRIEYNKRFLTARYIGFGIAGVCFILSLFMGNHQQATDETKEEEGDVTEVESAEQF